MLQEKPDFIECRFDVGDELAERLASLTKVPVADIRTVEVSRDFGGEYLVTFPKACVPREVKRDAIVSLLLQASNDISAIKPMKTEEDTRASILSVLTTTIASVPKTDHLTAGDLGGLLKALDSFKDESAPKTGSAIPRLREVADAVRTHLAEISLEHPNDVEGSRTWFLMSCRSLSITQPTGT